MVDNLTPEQRKNCMSRVRSKDTNLESLVRSALHRRGYRFRKHMKGLPGTPDIVFTKQKVVIFIDGDFWHGFDFDSRKDDLTDIWRTKIAANIERDARNTRMLQEEGWKTIRLWQHEIESDLELCLNIIVKSLYRLESQHRLE